MSEHDSEHDDATRPAPAAENPHDENPPFTDEQLEFLHATFDLAREGDGEQLVSFINQGVPVNLCNPKGDTYLMLASYHGHEDLVRELIGLGADLDLANQRGQTPLAGAVFRQYTPIVQMLIRAGANPDAGNPSARATADFFGLPAMAELLRGEEA